MASLNQWTWVWASCKRWWTGSLVCCSPWGHKESDTTEWVNNNKFTSIAFFLRILQERLALEVHTLSFFKKIDFGPFSSPESIFKIIYIFDHQKLGRRKAEFCGFIFVYLSGAANMLSGIHIREISFPDCIWFLSSWICFHFDTYILLFNFHTVCLGICLYMGNLWLMLSTLLQYYLCIDFRCIEGIDILRQETYF